MTFRLVAAALVLACAVAVASVASTKDPGTDVTIACLCPQKTPDWLCRLLCL